MSAGVAPDPAAQQQQLEAALLADTTDAAGQHADHLDSDDDFQYEEVEVPRYAQTCNGDRVPDAAHTWTHTSTPCCRTMHSGEEDEDDDMSEDLDAAMHSLQALTSKVSGLPRLTEPHTHDSSAAAKAQSNPRCVCVGVLVSLQGRTGSGSAAAAAAAARKPATPPGHVVRRPEVIDDFVRNFFVRCGLSRTAEVFESEWYELKATGRLEAAGSTVVPDIYLHNGVSATTPRTSAQQTVSEC